MAYQHLCELCLEHCVHWRFRTEVGQVFLASSSLSTRAVESVWGGYLGWGSALEEKELDLC